MMQTGFCSSCRRVGIAWMVSGSTSSNVDSDHMVARLIDREV
jgi:hypothetical protein